MLTQITDALFYDSASGQFLPGVMTLDGDKILALTRPGEDCPAAERVVRMSGRLVAPGLVDVHTHGRAGGDFTSADEGAMRRMARAYADAGVTSLMPTLASAAPDELRDAVGRIAALRKNGSGGARFLGPHLEGRYLNPAKRGAHAPELLAPLDPDEIEELVFRMCRPPVHVSAALELDRDGEFLRRVLALGGSAGIAHTNATLEEALRALEEGAVSFTHLFNCQPPLHHRQPGAVCAALTSDAYVELICDGQHVHPRMVTLAYRAKERGKFVLITDSMEATGEPDGEYTIAGMPVTVRGGRAVTHDGALAGSLLSLFDGVLNLADFAGITLGEALLCATRAPADMIGCGTVGDLLPGRYADFLVLNVRDGQPEKIKKTKIAEVWLGGERYS